MTGWEPLDPALVRVLLVALLLDGIGLGVIAWLLF